MVAAVVVINSIGFSNNSISGREQENSRNYF